MKMHRVSQGSWYQCSRMKMQYNLIGCEVYTLEESQNSGAPGVLELLGRPEACSKGLFQSKYNLVSSSELDMRHTSRQTYARTGAETTWRPVQKFEWGFTHPAAEKEQLHDDENSS